MTWLIYILGVVALEILLRYFSNWKEGVFTIIGDNENTNKDTLFIICVVVSSWVSVIVILSVILYFYCRYLRLIKIWVNVNSFLIHEYLITDNTDIVKNLEKDLLRYMNDNKIQGEYSPRTFETLLKDKIKIGNLNRVYLISKIYLISK